MKTYLLCIALAVGLTSCPREVKKEPAPKHEPKTRPTKKPKVKVHVHSKHEHPHDHPHQASSHHHHDHPHPHLEGPNGHHHPY